jgi:cytochrome c553
MSRSVSGRPWLAAGLVAAVRCAAVGIAATGCAAAGIRALSLGAMTIAAVSIAAAAIAAAESPPADVPAGVPNPQRAWQNWTLNCQGCHRQDGAGSSGTAPSLKDTVSKFLGVPGGREYLGRVPGVATSPLQNAELAELMNWMFWRFDKQHLPADFSPFTAEEIGRLRTRPLRLEAAAMRTALLQEADGPAAP